MLKNYCSQRVNLIDAALDKLISNVGKYPPTIFDAMRYSLFAGGKRLRPIMLMAASEAIGGTGLRYLNVAAGLEMIHTYSLIHDDLPAMDNDDFRRGKLTNHKVFGEGVAILTGDAMLTAAFEVILSQNDVEAQTLLRVAKEIAVAAGANGMVGGQIVDLESEGKTIDEQTLEYMHKAKTGALFKASVRAGAILAGASETQVKKLTEYAEQFGLAFQITDDILDVIGTQEKIGKPVGSDIKNEKVTYVSLYTLKGAQNLAKEAVEKAIDSLEGFGEGSWVLRELVKYLVERES